MQPTTNPHLIIGKNGLTEAVITEIKEKLKKEKTLFIKINKAGKDTYDRKELAQLLTQQTKTTLLSMRGGSILIGKR